MRMRTEENRCLFSHNSADDKVIVAQEADDLEFILKRLKTAYKDWGLTIKFNETQFIAIDIENRENVTIKQIQIFISLNKKVINSEDIYCQ